MTDEFSSYQGLDKDFAGHESVNHSKKEYVRKTKKGLAHVNSCESFFALLKRGHYGTYHKMSKKHLHRYCAEFGFRWNHRKVDDGTRAEAAVKGAPGKRLLYKQPVSSDA